MGIFDELKRMYYRYKNNDPFYNCDYFKNESCGMIDDSYCNISNCKILSDFPLPPMLSHKKHQNVALDIFQNRFSGSYPVKTVLPFSFPGYVFQIPK